MNSYYRLVTWLALTVLYVYLFYDEKWGFNALAFTIIIIAVLAKQQRELLRSANGKLAILAHIVTTAATVWHGGQGMGVCYHLSLLILTGMAFAPQSSVITAFVNGLLSRIWKGLGKGLTHFSALGSNKFLNRFILLRQTALYAAPISFTFLFYWLYTLANPDFLISIRWPEWRFDWDVFLYILMTVFITAPVVFPSGLEELTRFDNGKENFIARVKGQGGLLKLENKQGVVMFVLLNILIAAFLVFNVLQFFFKDLVTQSAGHSAQVHSSFNSVIVSVIIAICLIVYYFRGNQNFFSGNGRLRAAAVIWILLNFGLVLLTCSKNARYVQEFGLTYKRIWVFTAMLAVSIGLFLTYIKIFKLKSTWYLIRLNSWVVYLLFVCYLLVDWDKQIASYNLHVARNTDWDYLSDLGMTAFPEIEKFKDAWTPEQKAHFYRYSTSIHNDLAFCSQRSWKSQNLDLFELYQTYENEIPSVKASKR